MAKSAEEVRAEHAEKTARATWAKEEARRKAYAASVKANEARGLTPVKASS